MWLPSGGENLEQLDHVTWGNSPACSPAPQVSFGPCLLTILVCGENSPLPIHLPFLPVYGRAVGEGPSSQEPHADAVRNIGFNELQNEVAAADMYGCPHQPPPLSPSTAS